MTESPEPEFRGVTLQLTAASIRRSGTKFVIEAHMSGTSPSEAYWDEAQKRLTKGLRVVMGDDLESQMEVAVESELEELQARLALAEDERDQAYIAVARLERELLELTQLDQLLGKLAR